MKWERVELGEVCDFQGGSQPPKKEWVATPQNGYIRMLQIRDFTQGKEDHIAFVRDSDRLKKCNNDDILIGRYGASIGKILKGLSGAYNVAMIKTIPNEKELNKDFLYYYLVSPFFQSFINGVGTRAAQAGFNKGDISQAQIPLPPLPEQRRLAARLDKADALRQKSRAVVETYAELGRSVFLEVFGDDKLVQFKKTKLSEVADVVSGVAKGKKYKETDLIEIPYMRVANVQDGYLDLEEIKNLKVPQKEIDRYLLEKGDVLLTEGGDPDKLGRGHVWNQEVSPCIHQNHIYRVRLNQTKLLPIFFSAYVGSKYGKKYFLRAAKQTTGIATINLTQLRNFPTILPPLPLQTRFAAMVANIEAQRRLAERQLEAAEAVFGGVLQGTFEG
ncbi:MAG: restriction endonuclease subunit S [Phaeodactylibacter sp.]|uniref:restriction endonuclease subunit S n=1 Tax=Phaeodactylibacter sp. TaxID=1940289 RepID=UPI0032EC673C